MPRHSTLLPLCKHETENSAVYRCRVQCDSLPREIALRKFFAPRLPPTRSRCRYGSLRGNPRVVCGRCHRDYSRFSAQRGFPQKEETPQPERLNLRGHTREIPLSLPCRLIHWRSTACRNKSPVLASPSKALQGRIWARLRRTPNLVRRKEPDPPAPVFEFSQWRLCKVKRRKILVAREFAVRSAAYIARRNPAPPRRRA